LRLGIMESMGARWSTSDREGRSNRIVDFFAEHTPARWSLRTAARAAGSWTSPSRCTTSSMRNRGVLPFAKVQRRSAISCSANQTRKSSRFS
jgi:hypothetical protein